MYVCVCVCVCACIYIYFLVNNRDQYKLHSEIHSINIRQYSNVNQPLSNLTRYQKGTHYCGIKAFNNLPSDINRMSHYVTQFRLALHDFLHLKSFKLWMSILIVPTSRIEKFITMYFLPSWGVSPS